MTPNARRRFGALVALAFGLFAGLTLLPIPVTGPVGTYFGHELWQLLGAGALGIPLLGFGLALAGFERLGALDMKRSAVLIIGLSLLVPYLIGVVTHVRPTDLDVDVADRTSTPLRSVLCRDSSRISSRPRSEWRGRCWSACWRCLPSPS